MEIERATMNKMKIMTIVGTRPEIIKLSEIIKKCDRYFAHTLVHTGQNYDYMLNDVFFHELGVREPDYFLEVATGNLGVTIGNIIAKSYEVIAEEQPDAVLILGDTNSGLSAISAKRLKVPIFHLEAGNRCFDENLPEELNRRLIDHTSDVNLCYTEHARRYLIGEGISRERIFVIGSPMPEVLDVHVRSIQASDVLSKFDLIKSRFILLSAHREENIDIEENFYALMESINYLAEKYGMQILYSAHPRSRKFLKQRSFIFHNNVKIVNPLSFFDYNHLQQNAYCVISDSGTLAEEASYFKFPAVSLRTSTERPEALERANFIVGGITRQEVAQAVELAVEMHGNEDYGSDVPDYSDRNISTKVINLIQSYKEIVNKNVWRKP